jgi:hypothetical protein
VSVKSIIEEEDVVAEDGAKLLEEYKNMFLVKSPSDLPLKKDEDDYAIPTIPRVTLGKISIQIDVKRKRSVENMVKEIDRS